MRLDARAAILSWIVAAPALALAWPLAWELAGWAGPLVALLVARQGISLLMRGASTLVRDEPRATSAAKLHREAAPRQP